MNRLIIPLGLAALAVIWLRQVAQAQADARAAQENRYPYTPSIGPDQLFL